MKYLTADGRIVHYLYTVLFERPYQGPGLWAFVATKLDGSLETITLRKDAFKPVNYNALPGIRPYDFYLVPCKRIPMDGTAVTLEGYYMKAQCVAVSEPFTNFFTGETEYRQGSFMRDDGRVVEFNLSDVIYLTGEGLKNWESKDAPAY